MRACSKLLERQVRMNDTVERQLQEYEDVKRGQGKTKESAFLNSVKNQSIFNEMAKRWNVNELKKTDYES